MPGLSCGLGAVGGLRAIIQGPRAASHSGCNCIKPEGAHETQVGPMLPLPSCVLVLDLELTTGQAVLSVELHPSRREAPTFSKG